MPAFPMPGCLQVNEVNYRALVHKGQQQQQGPYCFCVLFNVPYSIGHRWKQRLPAHGTAVYGSLFTCFREHLLR